MAGQRAGLDGARSGLWFEFQRILRELRPRWAIIENVPGLLSSNQGADFGVILDGLGECGFGGISWAILDSQHFGVPQRRRRVFVVCGPTARSTEQVLSLCESCGGHPQKSREAGEAVAATIRGRAHGPGSNEPGRGGEDDTNLVVANPLGASTTSFGGQRYDLDNETYVPELSYALAARNEKGVSLLEGQDTLVAGYTIHGTDKTQRVASETELAGSIRTKAPGSQENSSTTVAVTGAAVRRLTPTECARLQALPDDWLDLDPPLADGPKYRMLGNAVTTSVVTYIGRRILELDR